MNTIFKIDPLKILSADVDNFDVDNFSNGTINKIYIFKIKGGNYVKKEYDFSVDGIGQIKVSLSHSVSREFG